MPWAAAEAVHRQTEGNPLFVQEVLRYLVEEGLVVREGGRYVRADGDDPRGRHPRGPARRHRQAPLAPQRRRRTRLLAIAAVIGRDFRLDVLQTVAGLPEEEVDAALEEAARAARSSSSAQAVGALGFRFTHAFFRQTLYEEIIAPRRLRLHQQVARALEAGLRPPAATSTPPSWRSTSPSPPTPPTWRRRVALRRAGGAAGDVASSPTARRCATWSRRSKVQEVLDPDDKPKRCDLLLALGEAMLPLEEPRRVADTVAEEAFELAEALGDSPRAARAAVQALEALR